MFAPCMSSCPKASFEQNATNRFCFPLHLSGGKVTANAIPSKCGGWLEATESESKGRIDKFMLSVHTFILGTKSCMSLRARLKRSAKAL